MSRLTFHLNAGASNSRRFRMRSVGRARHAFGGCFPRQQSPRRKIAPAVGENSRTPSLSHRIPAWRSGKSSSARSPMRGEYKQRREQKSQCGPSVPGKYLRAASRRHAVVSVVPYRRALRANESEIPTPFARHRGPRRPPAQLQQPRPTLHFCGKVSQAEATRQHRRQGSGATLAWGWEVPSRSRGGV
jgi:hypothetical protein